MRQVHKYPAKKKKKFIEKYAPELAQKEETLTVKAGDHVSNHVPVGSSRSPCCELYIAPGRAGPVSRAIYPEDPSLWGTRGDHQADRSLVS